MGRKSESNQFTLRGLSVAAVALAAMSLAPDATAGIGIRLGTPNYGGTGCPAGSASVTLSPGEDQLSILFDQFQVEAGGPTGRAVDRKNCDISIPVQVPQGYAVSVFKMDYRGFNSLPYGASSRLDLNYFFTGQSGVSSQRQFVGQISDSYFVQDQVVAQSMVWSACGASTILRTHAAVQAQTNSGYEQALMTLDSVDIDAGVVFNIQWRRCDGYPTPFPQPLPPTPQPYPQPQPLPPAPLPYPQPQPYPGYGRATECTIELRASSGYGYQRDYYVVVDSRGNELGRTFGSSYSEALEIKERLIREGRCSSDRYIPSPSPYPSPYPRPGYPGRPGFPGRPEYPSLREVEVSCGSWDRNIASCGLPAGTYGRIENVRISMQVSRAACIQGSSWGFDSGSIWVSNGCRATFVATVR